MDTILQWNSRSVTNKKTDLFYLINKHKPIIIALCETWLKHGQIFGIPGYSCIRNDRSDGYGGVAILIKNNVAFSQIVLPNQYSLVDFVGVRVDNVSYASAYVPKASSLALQEINNIFSSLQAPYLVMGDFNCHHQSWGSGENKSEGVRLLQIVDDSNLCILNTGVPTRRTNPHELVSAVDLSICTPSLASLLHWSVFSSSTLGSDHYPIFIESPIKYPLSEKRAPRLKYRLAKADWDTFRELLESKVPQLPEILSGSSEEDCSRALALCMLEVADSIFPVKGIGQSGIPMPPWWDAQCSDAVQRRKEAERVYAEDMSDENLVNLQDIIKETREYLRDRKLEGWRSFCSSISPGTCPSEVWNNIKRFRTAFSVARSGVQLSSTLADRFLDRLAPPSAPKRCSLSLCYISDPISEEPNSLNSPFSLYELKGVLSSVRDSCPGEDGIPYSFFSNLGDSILAYYLDLINAIMFSGNIPTSWRTQEIIPILKPYKFADDPASYRPIALSLVIVKIAEHLVKNRLEWYIESNLLLSMSQYGFRKAKSTMDSLSVFTTDINLAFSENQSIVAAFLDVSAAYDNVLISVLKSKLVKLKVPCILTNFIINLLSIRYIFLITNQGTKISRTVFKGLPQGSVLSPLLYNIYAHDLESSLNGSVNVLQYADDLLLYSVNKSIACACNSLTGSLNLLKQWLDNNGLGLSIDKSSVVVFSRKREFPQPVVYYDNLALPIRDDAKFLGVILDKKMTGKSHFRYIADRCEKQLNIMRCLSGVWWGAHPYNMKLLYNAIIRSILDYGTFLLEGGSKKGFSKLDNIQSRALRIIAGAMRSSPLNALQVECGEPPLHIRRQFLSDRFVFKAMQFSNHPLINKLETLNSLIESSKYWRHKTIPALIVSFRKFKSLGSPVHSSSRLAIFNNNSYNSLLVTPYINYSVGIEKNDPGANIKFKSNIDDKWKDWHHLFTDSSKFSNSCVGVGVYHAQYKVIQKVKLPPETSVYTGECFGLFKALEYVSIAKLKKTVIFTDSKSTLQTIEKFPFKMKPFYPIVFDIRSLLHELGLKGYSVQFAWIPSHCGIDGNEKADELAKDAVINGDIFPYKNFNHDIINLPKTFLREAWDRLWAERALTKGRAYFALQPSIPHKPWFFKIKCTKLMVSQIIRMRLGHVCTPSHLARLRIVDSDLCECGDVGTLDHIFFSCSRHDRTAFFRSLVSLKVPLPTRISCLVINPLLYYDLISSFLYKNDIKI